VRFDGDTAESEGEAANARLVQPLQVVDDERDWLGLGELRQQSPDRQGYRQGIDLAPVGFGTLQSNCEGAPLWTRKATVRSLGKLADQFGQPRKGQSSVELGRSARNHPVAADLGQLSRGPQQAALPSTGIADCDHTSATDQDVVHDSQSVLAAKQPERGRYLVHEVIIL
jgi:hypothetical protein